VSPVVPRTAASPAAIDDARLFPDQRLQEFGEALGVALGEPEVNTDIAPIESAAEPARQGRRC
jgi:hypothetical protein